MMCAELFGAKRFGLCTSLVTVACTVDTLNCCVKNSGGIFGKKMKQ